MANGWMSVTGRDEIRGDWPIQGSVHRVRRRLRLGFGVSALEGVEEESGKVSVA